MNAKNAKSEVPNIKLEFAARGDVPRLTHLHNCVAEHLTSLHGIGPWSSKISVKGMEFALRNYHVFVARNGSEIIATLHLTARKPWAIDKSYFTFCDNPLYLLSMAVQPARQRQGIGRGCLHAAAAIAKSWPAAAIRLDAYDADAGAGAGNFYASCGYTEMGRASYRGVPLIYFELLLD